ncbi:probable RNA-directed DNA polymerase from transposon BS [Trichonephila clavipes]|nr:probable RNA-directed DNA polymerase from transposon BS [Trichonephila clavipes]
MTPMKRFPLLETCRVFKWLSCQKCSPFENNNGFLIEKKRCSSPVTNTGCNFSPSMSSTPSIANAASVVSQSKKDRIPGLGRGQETKLKTFTSLKIKGYNIFRLNRQNRSGGSLAFLIKNINYQCININRKITDGSNLEIQCIRIICEDRNIAVNVEQAADPLGLHYQKISRLNFSVEDRNIKIRASRIVNGCRSDTHRGTSIFIRDFRVNELEAEISDSCLNKSHKGQLPRNWKKATVIPIKKWGKTDGTPESYRPIALTNIACKIMEKMVLKRLTFHLHSHSLLPEEQYGFREGHSTTYQLLYFCQRIRDAHNRKPTNPTVAVFLDLSKAFDRVWNNFLVIKLFKIFGIGGKALPWIYDFLRNRLIRVKFNNSLSRSFSFFQGEPQGSVLSPTLFSLYLSGIESVIKRKCEVGAFADDIVLWQSDSDLTKLERDINLILEDIRNFSLDYKLTFNHTKSVVSFLKTNRKLYNFQPNIFLYNQPLTIDKHTKYLGFILDPEILGNKHIDNIVFKARKRLNILRYISGRDWGADAGTLRNTHISLIRPI